MKELFLSIIVPVYNEEKRIEKALIALNSYLPKQKFQTEVIFVDDGSTDNTVKKIKQNKNNFIFQLMSYSPNKGKGYAIKQGVGKASGDYILFLDADMSTPIDSIDKIIPYAKAQVPVIIGTRKSKGAEIKVPQSPIRQKMGEVYTFLSNLLIGGGITDFTCGFKGFSKESAKKIFSSLQTNRWSYDAEIIFLARRNGFEIVEVPVKWSDDPNSKVVLGKDSLESLLDLLRIRFRKY